jgi:predicted nucleic acid-binding Zn ribbon protein
MKSLDVRHCDYCGVEFEPIRFDQRFHSRECHDQYFMRERRLALQAWRAQRRLQFRAIVEDVEQADVV